LALVIVVGGVLATMAGPSGGTLARVAGLGACWPLFTYLPLLPLRGDRDVYRLGLLMAFGFALLWSAALGQLWARRPRLAPLAIAVLAFWFGWAAIRSSQAWGPGGFAMTAGTRWKLGNEGWLAGFPPEVRDLFARQAVDFVHRTEEWR
jgi:hypothetical protein